MTDVLGAVFDFLQARLSPAPPHIVRGWGNRAALPDSNEFVVLTLIGAARRGTNVRQWKMPANQAPGLDLNLAMLTVYDVQADFCGHDEESVSRMASQFVILGRDAVAVDFFRPYGLSALHTDDPRALPFTNDQNQWQTRYSVTLHLAGWADVDVNVDAFDKVHITLENVDVHASAVRAQRVTDEDSNLSPQHSVKGMAVAIRKPRRLGNGYRYPVTR